MNVLVRDAVGISRLSALERDVAGVLAVLGEDLSLDWLQRIAAACGIGTMAGKAMSRRELGACVDRLIRAGLVVEAPDRSGCPWHRMPVGAEIGVLRELEREQGLVAWHDRIDAAVRSGPGGAWHEASPGRARVAAVRATSSAAAFGLTSPVAASGLASRRCAT